MNLLLPCNFLVRYNLSFPSPASPPFFLHSATPLFFNPPSPRRSWRKRGEKLPGPGPDPDSHPGAPRRRSARREDPVILLFVLALCVSSWIRRLRCGRAGGRRAFDSAAAPSVALAIREIERRWRGGAG